MISMTVNFLFRLDLHNAKRLYDAFGNTVLDKKHFETWRIFEVCANILDFSQGRIIPFTFDAKFISYIHRKI